MTLLFRRAAKSISFRVPLTNLAVCGSRPLLFSTSRTTWIENNNAISAQETKPNSNDQSSKGANQPPEKAKKKTIAELDEELKLKMEGMSGGGGSAGVEYENGKAEGLKRGVKDNMFRVI